MGPARASNEAMSGMHIQLDGQWARSAAAVVIGFTLLCGMLRTGTALSVPGELRPLLQLIATAGCIVWPEPVRSGPGAAPRLGRPGT